MTTDTTDLVKDVDGTYLHNSGESASYACGDTLILSFRILCGASESSDVHDTDSNGKEARASGCGTITGCMTGSTSMCNIANVIAISRYIGIWDAVDYTCCVDATAVVTGLVGPAMFDKTKDGVASADAGTSCAHDEEVGCHCTKGDADKVRHDKVLVHIFNFGGAGFTIWVTSSVNAAETVE